jgi:hypothetical protein
VSREEGEVVRTLSTVLSFAGAACFGMGVVVVLDHFGLVGGEAKGTSAEWVLAAALLAGSGVLFWAGNQLRRRS